MRFKKTSIVSWLLCLVLAFSLTACGTGKEAGESSGAESTGAGSTAEAAAYRLAAAEEEKLPDAGWQAQVTFPDWKGYTDDTLAMNSMFSFFGYHGQGKLYVRTSEKTESFRMYVNGQLVDTRAAAAGKTISVDISSAALDGINTVQISNIRPTSLAGAVDLFVPYPEVLPGTPEEEGISPQAIALISDLIQSDVDNGFPSAQLAVVRNGRLVYENAWGRTNSYLPDGTPCTDSPEVTTDTLYDLASVTKMFTVNYALQKLLTDGEVNLDAKITEYLGDEFVDDTILIPEEKKEEVEETTVTVETEDVEKTEEALDEEELSGAEEPAEEAEAETAQEEASVQETDEVSAEAGNDSEEEIEGESEEAAEEDAAEEADEEDKPDLDTIKAWKADLTIRDLLRHQGGFPVDPRYNAPALYVKDLPEGESFPENVLFAGNAADEETRQNTIHMICKTPLEYEPGTKTVYSDVDYMILGLVVEQITGEGLDTWMKKTFFEPMGLTHITFNPLENGFEPDDCAATELNGNTRDGLLDFDGYRTDTIQGQVHDEKAYYCMAGVSGHAGLFSNASDLARLASVMLCGGYGENRFFSDNVIDMFSAPKKEDAANWGLGWWRQGDNQRVWYFGTQAASGTIGHQGWTGTLVMIDPDRNLVIAYLTNRTNSPVTDKEEDANVFDGNWYTANTLGFVPQILSIGMDTDEDISVQLLDLVEDMTFESVKLLPENVSPESDHPAARNVRSKQQLYEKYKK